MWIKKKKYEGMVDNFETMSKTLGVLMSDIAQYYPAEFNRENPYRTKEAQVAEILKKYHGMASFGNQILPRIVNLRVAFSIPNRLLIKPTEGAEDASKTATESAQDFLKAFMSLNGLDASLPRDLARESEFSGEVLVRLVWDKEEKLPRLFYYPWTDTGYKIEPKEMFSPTSELKAKYQYEGKEVNLQNREFSFIAFNDELIKYVGYPTAGGVLKDIENIDKDVRDWRKLNHLFAHPTPHFKCETPDQAKQINAMISNTGWKVGTAIATNAEFMLKGATGAESNLLMLAIQTNIKIVSAHTGIGVHFLGFANVMSNRATADSMGEPTEVVLHSEISSWKKFYKDMFNKAIEMRNEHLNRPIQTGLVEPRLVPLTDRQWRHIKEIYMDGAKEHLLSLRTLLDNIPGIDVDAELKRLEEEDAKREEKKEKQPQQQEQDAPQEETELDEAKENKRDTSANAV
jgi:hypothetical protein